ncbi:MAG: phosphopyruvate hydratase [Candidatus Nealsonbacteria bacterium]
MFSSAEDFSAKGGQIKSIKAREILDSRGNPTVEVDLTTDFGIFQSSVPSGISKGKYEAVEIRDGGKRCHGKGVRIAVKNVNEIIGPKLKGKDPTKQMEIDNLMIKLDGTKNKSKLGGNSILGLSMAVCRAGAKAKKLPLWKYISQITKTNPILPTPSVLVIEGGLHAGNELDFQEFMIVPQVKRFSKALEMASEIYQELKNIIKEKYIDLAINVGDEGGFVPPVRVPEEAIELILRVAKNLGYQDKIAIILDIAASQFYVKGTYKMKIGAFTKQGLLNYYSTLIKKYPILGLEDPFGEEDWEGWKALSSKTELPSMEAKVKKRTKFSSPFKVQSSKLLIIGDDLLATNIKRMKMAKEKNACNAVIIKPNQIGTVTEAISAVKLAKHYGWKIMVSHRGGDTCDDFIADFAVGISADFIKAGAPARGERVAKYNRLLRIEEKVCTN